MHTPNLQQQNHLPHPAFEAIVNRGTESFDSVKSLAKWQLKHKIEGCSCVLMLVPERAPCIINYFKNISTSCNCLTHSHDERENSPSRSAATLRLHFSRLLDSFRVQTSNIKDVFRDEKKIDKSCLKKSKKFWKRKYLNEISRSIRVRQALRVT